MNAHTLNTTLFPYTTLFRSSLQIKRLHPDAVLPVRAHSTDAGLDLHAVEDVGIPVLGRNLRSEEHTSELQSRGHLVCRLLLEKKNRRDIDRESKCVTTSEDE